MSDLFLESALLTRRASINGEVLRYFRPGSNRTSMLMAALLLIAGTWLSRIEYTRKLEVLGTAESLTATNISANRHGWVRHIAVREGDAVAIGQLLAVVDANLGRRGANRTAALDAMDRRFEALALDRRTIESAHEQELASLHLQLRHLDRQIDGVRQQIDVSSAMSDRERTIHYASARLARDGHLPRVELFRVQHRLLAHENDALELAASLRSLEQQRREIESMLSAAPSRRRQALMSNREQLAVLRMQRLDLESTRFDELTSPVTGTVSRLSVRTGGEVAAGVTLMVLSSGAGPGIVSIYVPESLREDIKLQMPVTLHDPVDHDRSYTGHISHASDQPIVGTDGNHLFLYRITPIGDTLSPPHGARLDVRLQLDSIRLVEWLRRSVVSH